jgi:hypothetical protein
LYLALGLQPTARKVFEQPIDLTLQESEWIKRKGRSGAAVSGGSE